MVYDTIGVRKANSFSNKFEGRIGTWSRFKDKLLIKVSWKFHPVGKRTCARPWNYCHLECFGKQWRACLEWYCFIKKKLLTTWDINNSHDLKCWVVKRYMVDYPLAILP